MWLIMSSCCSFSSSMIALKRLRSSSCERAHGQIMQVVLFPQNIVRHFEHDQQIVCRQAHAMSELST